MDENEEDFAIFITEKGAVMAQVAPKLIGHGLTAYQILDSFGVELDEDFDDEDAEKMLGILMYTARYYGVID